MRILVVIAVSWMAGLVAPTSPAWLVVLLAGTALSWRAQGWRAAAGLALAALAGGALSRAIEPPAAAPRSGVIEGVVARPPEERGGERSVVVALDDGVRVLVVERAPRIALIAGDRIRFVGDARPPRSPGIDGAFDRARHLAGRGIALEAHAEPPGLLRIAEAPRASLWRAASWARERAALGLAASGWRGDGAALVQALVLGRRGEVRPALDDAFRRAGVAHVLSVSGVHLAAATFLVFALARAFARRVPWLVSRAPADAAAAAAAIPAAIAYTLITGAEVATVRALVCALLVLGARVLGRSADALTALAAAALILLVDAPLVIYEPSFQLSFAAAAALALVAARLRGRGRLVSAVIASTAATLATAPLTALAFGVVQPGGVIANLIVVPLAELLVLPLGLLAALLGMIAPPAGATFAALATLAGEGLARIVLALASFLPTWDVPPPRPLELAALGLAVVAALALPWRRALPLAAAGLAVCALSIFTGSSVQGGLRVTFLDVGQGDAALVETPAGERWLIDAGGRLFGEDGDDPGERVRRFLAVRRIGRIDVVLISHPHPDHYGGLAALAGRVAVGELWVSGDDPGDPRWAALAGRFPRLVTVAAGAAREAKGARLEVLAPDRPDPLRSVNDNSLVVGVTFAGRRLLFTGDIEAGAEAALRVPADVVKVAHHGSRTSSSEAFVRAVHPLLAVVSCGRDNRFGFPAPEVVERWRAAGAEVLRTDEVGSITVEVAGDGTLRYRAFRGGSVR